MTPAAWRRLAWHASTISERTTVVSLTEQPRSSPSDWSTTGLVRDWVESTPDWSERDVVQRIEQSDFDEAVLAATIDVDTLPPGAELPEWVATAQAIGDAFTDTHTRVTPDLGKPDDEVPFADIYAPIVAFARGRVLESGLDRLPESALRSMQDALRQDLERLCQDVLYVEFRTHIAVNRPQALADPESPPKTDLYDSFVDGLRTADGLASLFSEYPVLPRFLARVVSQWCDAVQELDRRLDDDWQMLTDTFDVDTDATSVTAAAVLDSDRHADGRRVVALTFDDQTRIVYKPRSVQPAAAFDAFLQEAGNIVDVDTRSVSVLDRETYGWVEHVDADSCQSRDDIGTYYQRAGVVLASAYLLYLNDCHYENVVANAASPVVVDAETMLTPSVSPAAGETAPTDAVTGDGSVLWTGLLPRSYDAGPIPESAMVNGFGVPEIPVGSGPVASAWSAVNTNAMSRRERKVDLMSPPARNVPAVESAPDSPVAASQYVNEIAETFASVCRAVVEDRLSLPESFSTLETRVLFRNTQEYDGVLSALQSPETLQDGRRLTFTTDVLVSEAMLADGTDPAWDVVAAERCALYRLDVPRLTADAATGALKCGDASITGITDSAGYQRVKHRFEHLDEATVRTQRDIVELALDTTAVDEPEDAVPSRPPDATYPPPDASTLASAVGDIYDTILEATVETDGDASDWVVRRATGGGRLQVGTAGDGLYEGGLGVAVFAAVIADQLDRSGARETALALTGSLRDSIRADGAAAVDGLGLDGVGGTVYGLTVVGRILDAPGSLETAVQLVDTLDPDRITAADSFDVMRGVAGTVLGCLALHEHRPESDALKIARMAGDVLVAAATRTDGGVAWPTGPDGESLTGYAHGAAGIAHALGRLATVTDTPGSVNELSTEVGDTEPAAGFPEVSKYLACASDALAFERATFDAEQGNWPDRRERGPAFADAWCHGRTGGVLARTALQDTPLPVTEDIVALAHRTGVDSRPDDGLCCGAAGRLVGVTAASEHAADDELTAHAHARLVTGLHRHLRGDSWNLSAHTTRVPNPTLFQGLAGVGYALLYAANPTDVPNVLYWETP